MTPANLEELSAELGHAHRLVSLPLGEFLSALARLLETNGSPEEDWLIQTARWLLITGRGAANRGAIAVRFETCEASSANEGSRLFVWESEALKDYYRGQIIVLADTLEEARSKAREAFVSEMGHLGMTARETLERDLGRTPEIRGPGAILILGSG